MELTSANGIQLVADVGELKGLVTGINARLDKMNGAIATSIAELNQTKIDLALHPVNCPLKLTVDELQRELSTGDHPGSKEVMDALMAFNVSEAARRASERTKESTSRKFLEWGKPFIIGFIMTTLVLIAIHFYEIWKVKP
jgi:hypothetical protein